MNKRDEGILSIPLEANENEPSIIGMKNDLNESTSSNVSLGPISASSMFNLGSMVPSALPQLASTPSPSLCLNKRNEEQMMTMNIFSTKKVHQRKTVMF